MRLLLIEDETNAASMQAMLILLGNACKYTPAGGVIQIDVMAEAEKCTVRVSDTGIGIPEAAQTHIFERFYRVNKARFHADFSNGDGGGAGLGLAIARWIVQVHGGTLGLESSGRSGSTFALQLSRTVPASFSEEEISVATRSNG